MQGLRILALLLLLPLAATFAFMAVEGWGFFDSFYMAVITLSTVGYHEVHPLGTGGRIVVIVYLLVGLGVFLAFVGYVGEMMLRVQLREVFGRRKMDTAIRALRDHVVVCGFGRMGRSLCQQLGKNRKKFVVIDRDAPSMDLARSDGFLTVEGDATDDATLKAAGIEVASGLAVVLPSDADNLYVVLSAHIMNPRLQILARATHEKSAEKLERAGANHVVSLYETGAHKMAQLLTNANLEDFMQILTSQGNKLDLAEIAVSETAPYCGKPLKETGFRSRGILIVGHQKPGGEFVLPPESSAIIEAGDTLIAFGDASAITELISSR